VGVGTYVELTHGAIERVCCMLLTRQVYRVCGSNKLLSIRLAARRRWKTNRGIRNDADNAMISLPLRGARDAASKLLLLDPS